MEYRGYIIDKTWKGYCYFQSGEKVYLANSIADAKEQIDSKIFERPHEVEFKGLIHSFNWLTDALDFIGRTGGELVTPFNAI